MKIHPTWLLNYAAVKKMGGTNYYIEICRDDYTGKCWREDSVYVYYLLWEDFFDTLSRECIPGYDFFEFTDVNKQYRKIMEFEPLTDNGKIGRFSRAVYAVQSDEFGFHKVKFI